MADDRVDDEVDQLYGARPEDFTGLRTELAAAAKKRGDGAQAKRISSCRKPTTAAWVLNLLARNGDAKPRLADLGERLRTAHAARDGDGIRALSAAQRKLIDSLVREGVAAAELTNPSAALRDDITGTLQAAIADPDVLTRLGTLAKAERWSGFGEFEFDDTEFDDADIVAADVPDEAEPDEAAEAVEAARLEAERAAQQQAEADLEAARAELRTAERKRDAAQKVVDDASRRVDELSVLAGRDGRGERGAVAGRAGDA